MRKLFLILALLLCSQQARAAIAFGNAAANGASASSVAVTLSPTTGSTVVVGVSIRTTTSTVSSVSDAHSGTYLKYVTRNNSTTVRNEIWVCLSSPASVTTITVNLSATSKVEAVAAYYTGVVAVGNGFDAAIASTTLPAAGSVINESNNWVVSIAACAGSSTFSSSIGNLRTSGVGGGGSGSTQAGASLIDNTSSTAGAYVNGRPSLSGAEVCAGGAIELRLASAAGDRGHVQSHASILWPTATSAAEVEIHQVTSGNLLIFNVQGTQTINSLADSNGTPSTAKASFSNGGIVLAVFYQANAASGSHQLTPTFASSSTAVFIVDEYTGIATASPLDVSASNTGTSTSPSSGSATTTQNRDLIYGTLVSSSTATAGSGYTIVGNDSASNLVSEGKTADVTGSFVADGSLSGSAAWLAVLTTWAASNQSAAPKRLPLLGIGAWLLTKVMAIYDSLFEPSVAYAQGHRPKSKDTVDADFLGIYVDYTPSVVAAVSPHFVPTPTTSVR